MKDFITIAAAKALGPDAQEDPNVETWAARAFSVIAILGSMEETNDEVGNILATALAKAPTSVVASGTEAVISAKGLADNLN